MNTEPNTIPIDAIDDPAIAMRTNVHEDNIEELMSDMKAVGLIQPITVRRVGERFEVIAGHRRTTAARLLGWAHIPANIVEADDNKAFTMRAIENLSRADVNPVDEACYIGELMQQSKQEVPQIAEMLHRSEEWVKQRLEVFNMPDYLQEYLRQKRISLGAALILNKIPDEATRRYLVNYAAQNGVTVAQANRWYINAKAESENPNRNVGEIISEANATPEVVIMVACARCGKPGAIPDMDYVPVHRDGCVPLGEVDAEQPLNSSS